MYRLNGFATQNTLKTLYVLEELGVPFEFKHIDLFKGAHKKEEFLKLNPMGKTPVLQHDDFNLFESGAICKYLANVENSALYPTDKKQRALVDQWMDFFSCHLGRWLSTLYFENIIKVKANLGSTDPKTCKEAEGFTKTQLEIVNQHLGHSSYFVGEELTIADFFAFAYIEQTSALNIDLEAYPNIVKWFQKIESRNSIQAAKKRLA